MAKTIRLLADGEKVAEARRAMGLTIRDVAEAMNVDPSTIYRWEKGVRTVPLSAGTTLAGAYGTRIGKIFVTVDRHTKFGKQL